MRAGWQYRRLGQVCKTASGATPLKSVAAYYDGGTVPWLLSGEVAQGEITESRNFITEAGLKNSAAKLFPKNSVLVAMYGATAGQVGMLRFESATNQAVCAILPNEKFIPEFLHYLFLFKKDELVATASGNAQPNISQIKIKNILVPFLPLDEQRRIVAVLDKAFAAIATVTANAQKNLINARALFESYLETALMDNITNAPTTDIGSEADMCFGFAFKSSGYAKHGNGVRLLRGDNVVNGKLRWEGVVRWPGDYSAQFAAFALNAGDIVLAMDRTWVKSGLKFAVIEESDLPLLQVQRVARLRSRSTILNRFLAYQIGSAAFTKYVLGIQTGLGVPHISGKQIAEFKFRKPSLQVQTQLIKRLDVLKEQCKQLEAAHATNIKALTELKQSLLQKAFAGELTATVVQTATPAANDNFATPQFTAQVLAFAYRRHEQKQKQRTFGHVKAQKTLHLVESIGGIDLGREPIKDVAGPNDMQHMLRATEWAAQQGFFEFTPRANGKGYDFKKLADYDACWADAEAATNPVAADLTRAIDLIVDTDSDFAELIATTHAAWNNLIRDRVETSDDTIVLAARDNWHISKLKYDPLRFHDAIRFIRTNGIVPDGTAKYVGGQASLF